MRQRNVIAAIALGLGLWATASEADQPRHTMTWDSTISGDWRKVAGAAGAVVSGTVREEMRVVRPADMKGSIKRVGNVFQVEAVPPSQYVVGRLFTVDISEVHVSDGAVTANQTIGVYFPGRLARADSYFTGELTPGQSYLLFLVPLMAEGFRYPEIGDLSGLAVEGAQGAEELSPFSPESEYGLLARWQAARAISAETAAEIADIIAQIEEVPPSVAVISPLTGEITPPPLEVSVDASDNVGVASVQLVLDGQPYGAAVTQPPLAWSLGAGVLAEGSHTVGAIARDTAGNQAEAQLVEVTIVKPTLSVEISGTGTGRVVSVPDGIDCFVAGGSLPVPVCSAPFTAGTTVQLVATPGPHSKLVGWSGACSGTASTCTVVVTGSQLVTAVFNERRHALNVNVNGSHADQRDSQVVREEADGVQHDTLLAERPGK